MVNSISSNTLLPGGWGGAESSELLIMVWSSRWPVPIQESTRATSLEQDIPITQKIPSLEPVSGTEVKGQISEQKHLYCLGVYKTAEVLGALAKSWGQKTRIRASSITVSHCNKEFRDACVFSWRREPGSRFLGWQTWRKWKQFMLTPVTTSHLCLFNLNFN